MSRSTRTFAGESYAGRYVPYISAAMLDANDTEYYNLSGAVCLTRPLMDIDADFPTARVRSLHRKLGLCPTGDCESARC